jgi:hypothetical protein
LEVLPGHASRSAEPTTYTVRRADAGAHQRARTTICYERHHLNMGM